MLVCVIRISKSFCKPVYTSAALSLSLFLPFSISLSCVFVSRQLVTTIALHDCQLPCRLSTLCILTRCPHLDGPPWLVKQLRLALPPQRVTDVGLIWLLTLPIRPTASRPSPCAHLDTMMPSVAFNPTNSTSSCPKSLPSLPQFAKQHGGTLHPQPHLRDSLATATRPHTCLNLPRSTQTRLTPMIPHPPPLPALTSRLEVCNEEQQSTPLQAQQLLLDASACPLALTLDQTIPSACSLHLQRSEPNSAPALPCPASRFPPFWLPSCV